MTEDEMVGWHPRLNGYEFEQAPGDGEGEGGLECCSLWGCKELDMTEQLSFQVRDNVGLSDPAGSSRSGQKIKDNIGSMYYVKFI